jgi:hypothetical protein
VRAAARHGEPDAGARGGQRGQPRRGWLAALAARTWWRGMRCPASGRWPAGSASARGLPASRSHTPSARSDTSPCRAAQFLCARLDSLPSRIAARSKPVPRRADPARRGYVVARSTRPATSTFSAIAAVRRQTSQLRVAAALLRARRCPARPGRSSTFAVPCFSYLAHCVLVSLARAVSHVITGIARAVVIVCRILALFRACRARILRAIINYFVIIVRTR